MKPTITVKECPPVAPEVESVTIVVSKEVAVAIAALFGPLSNKQFATLGVSLAPPYTDETFFVFSGLQDAFPEEVREATKAAHELYRETECEKLLKEVS